MDEQDILTQELLDLRDGTPEGEQRFRLQVMDLLRARPLPGLEPPTRGAKGRRVEGTITVLDTEGAVMFAVGRKGDGAQADVLSKDGNPSARTLLLGGAPFVLLVTIDDPGADLFELAANQGSLDLDGWPIPRVWVMGLGEVVLRHLAVENRRIGWWKRVKVAFGGAEPPPPNPLLVGV